LKKLKRNCPFLLMEFPRRKGEVKDDLQKLEEDHNDDIGTVNKDIKELGEKQERDIRRVDLTNTVEQTQHLGYLLFICVIKQK